MGTTSHLKDYHASIANKKAHSDPRRRIVRSAPATLVTTIQSANPAPATCFSLLRFV
jgi:hypothetical protein